MPNALPFPQQPTKEPSHITQNMPLGIHREEKLTHSYQHLESNSFLKYTGDFCTVLTYTELTRNTTGVQTKGIRYFIFGTLPREVHHLGKPHQLQGRLSWYLSHPHDTPVSCGYLWLLHSQWFYAQVQAPGSFCFLCHCAQAIRSRICGMVL